jgi:hypothetical protein
LLLCFSAGGLIRMTPFQSCTLASDSARSQELSEEQRKREVKNRLLELRREQKERQKERTERKSEINRLRKQRRLQSEQIRKEFKNEMEEAGGRRLLQAKYGLCVSEDQWKLIGPKLEKVINMWDQTNSIVGASLSFGSSRGQKVASVPKLQWHRPWKDKPLKDLTEAQRLADEIRILLEKKGTPMEVFRRKVAALRKARSKEAEIQKQLAEARRELREILTTRQEAVLVLQGWL